MADSELALINKVELRIALAESDQQFESSLKLYLAPILLKLASPHQETRKAILKIIQHLIPRITASREVKLPIESLLNQVKNPNLPENSDGSSVILYSLLFISRGLDRLSDEDRKNLIPKIIENISLYHTDVSSRLFNILGKLLSTWKSPSRNSSEFDLMNIFLQFDKHPNDEEFISYWISKVFMLLPSVANTPIKMPGLSLEDHSFLTKQAGVIYKDEAQIYEIKMHFLEFLKAGFQNSNLVIPLLVASVDGSSAINGISEVLLKKLNVDFENEELVNKLVSLFVGSGDRPPVKPTLQEKIISLLLKSKIVSNNPRINNVSSLGLASDYFKLKQSTVQLIKWVSTNNVAIKEETKNFQEFNINMAAQLKNSILGEGWPRMDATNLKNHSASIKSRQLQYEALGIILKTTPSLFLDDFSYVEFLFESLEGEIPEIRSSIQDALSSLSVHLPNLSSASKIRLKAISRQFLSINKTDVNENLNFCRYISIKFTNCAFPFHDAEARYLCILGTSKKNSTDTIEESVKGLDPYWFNIIQSSNTLEFKSTADLLGEHSTVEFPSFEDLMATVRHEMSSVSDKSTANIYQALGQAIRFLVQTLVMQAIKDNVTVVVPDQDWSVRLEKAIEVDQTVRNLLLKEINSISFSDCHMDQETKGKHDDFADFLVIIFDAFIGQYNEGSSIISDVNYISSLSMLISLSPSSVIAGFSSKIQSLLQLLNNKSLDGVSAKYVCKFIGIIASHPSVDDLTAASIFSSLITEKIPTYLLQNKLLATSHLISRLTVRKRYNIISESQLVSYCQLLLNSFEYSDAYNVILQCISQLSMFGVLGPTININLHPYAVKFIDIIKPKVRKCDEASVLTLAYLSLAFNENEPSIDFMQLIYDTHVSKQIEYIFTSGEAMVIIACGWESKLLTQQFDIQGEQVSFVPKSKLNLTPVLNRTLQACSNTKPTLRRSGCIWLLSIVQYCGHLEEVKSRAPEIHLSFIRFLADRDEFIQESASRGLSIVYEMGNKDLKETLVHGLLKSFIDSNSTTSFTSGSVEHDTELFEPELLRTNDGSVSTYKDVLNLASDVGDPSLVYKFMSLVKSSALWSSRKGMAFGLGSILSKSSLNELLSSNKHLSNKLIPKLYRYKYDPSTSVSSSMNEIWNALIENSSQTINDNFDIILKELLKGMGNKEWRVRQASTAALNDLLQLSSEKMYESKMEEIWNMSFRAMDDIKESVRKEGNNLTESLASTVIRTIETKSNGANSSKILNDLVPFLIGNKGLLHDSEDVKNFALKTILKLCKIGGKPMKSFIPTLTDTFVGLMSSLEPEVINYLILNADKYNIKNNDIDAKRLRSLGASPLMDAIERLLEELDESIMEEFVIKIQTSIKKSVGLPSKVCGSRVLVSLVTKQLHLVKPFGDKLLKVCISQLQDKNDAISSSFAIAAGYMCKISSIQSIIKYSEVINNLYFESENSRGREISAVASESVSKYSGDVFETIGSAFLPLAFIGKHDTNELVKCTFEREWIENTSGGVNSIKLYLEEILRFYEKSSNSNLFEIRQILGRSVSDLCKIVDDTSSFSNALNGKLIALLIESCKGKSWKGKELFLESLVSFSVRSKSFVLSNKEILAAVEKTVLVESKRRNKCYQKHSIKSLGIFIGNFPNENLVDNYINIMGEILTDEYYEDDSDDNDDDMDVDSSNGKSSTIRKETERLSFLYNIFDALFVAKEDYNSNILNFLLIKTSKSFDSKVVDASWRSKLKLCELLTKLLSKLKLTKINNEESNMLFENWKVLKINCLQNENIESVKIEFIRLCNSLLEYMKELNEIEKVEIIRDELESFKSKEVSNIVLTELMKVLE